MSITREHNAQVGDEPKCVWMSVTTELFGAGGTGLCGRPLNDTYNKSISSVFFLVRYRNVLTSVNRHAGDKVRVRLDTDMENMFFCMVG